jgi:hypothetical protein
MKVEACSIYCRLKTLNGSTFSFVEEEEEDDRNFPGKKRGHDLFFVPSSPLPTEEAMGKGSWCVLSANLILRIASEDD